MIIINQPEYNQDITYKIDTGVDANNLPVNEFGS